MASFLAKQLLGNQIDSVKGAVGEKEDKKTESDEEAELEQQRLREEEEERRKEKHRRMEEDRERMRQGIRDKYKLVKQEEQQPLDLGAGSIGRRQPGQPPMQLPGMGEEEDGSIIPKDMDDLKRKMTNVAAGVKGTVNEKMEDMRERCSVQ